MSCTPSKWETETTEGLITEIAQMISSSDVSNFNAAEFCKANDCSGMSPGQLAWCAHHFDLCPKVFDAAAAARTASTDIIKDDDPDRVAKRNAVRHALWVALMISAYGISERDALLITTAHEMDDRSKRRELGVTRQQDRSSQQFHRCAGWPSGAEAERVGSFGIGIQSSS